MRAILARYDIPFSVWTAERDWLARSKYRDPVVVHEPIRFLLDETMPLPLLEDWYGARYYFWAIIRVEPDLNPYVERRSGKIDWYSYAQTMQKAAAPGKRTRGRSRYALEGLPVTWNPKSANYDSALTARQMFEWLMSPSTSTKQEYYTKTKDRIAPRVHPGRKIWETIVLHYMARRGSMESEPVAFLGFIPNWTWDFRGSPRKLEALRRRWSNYFDTQAGSNARA